MHVVSQGVLMQDAIPMIPHVPSNHLELGNQCHCPSVACTTRALALVVSVLAVSDLLADAAQKGVPGS